MSLPQVPLSQLDVRPIDWTGLPKRYMNPGELEVLVALVRSVTPQHVIEVGCNVGRTAKALLDHVASIALYTGIDVPTSYTPAKRVQRNEVPDKPGDLVLDNPRFNLIVRPRGSLDLRARDLAPCDAMFIDGDHGREAVVHDTGLARSLVRKGGIIIWHDYHDLGTVDVKAVLDQLHAAYSEISYCGIKHVAGTWIAFERRP